MGSRGRALNRPRIVERPAITAALVTGLALLAWRLERDETTPLDRRLRRIARTRHGRQLARAMSPLFPLGLPGGYITIAAATAYWLRKNGKSGGRRIVTAACAGWLAHRAVKLVYRRERPMRAGERRRTDSYPSGHTTGATALALTTAAVLRREDLLSARGAAALAIALPVVMGSYRVIADDHWSTDVLGGWLLGGAVAACCAPPSERGVAMAGSKRPSRRHVRRGAPTSAA